MVPILRRVLETAYGDWRMVKKTNGLGSRTGYKLRNVQACRKIAWPRQPRQRWGHAGPIALTTIAVLDLSQHALSGALK